MNIENLNKAIKAYYKDNKQQPANVLFFAGAANNDLWHGPRETREDDPFPYVNFTHATAIIRDWNDDNLTDLYWDEDSDNITTINLNDMTDEDGNDLYNYNIFEVTVNDVKRALYGKELSVYV